MKNTVIFLTALLVLWIAGSSWYYVCKVRNDCQAASLNTQVENRPGSLTTDTLATPQVEVQASVPPAYTLGFESGRSSCQITTVDKNYFDQIKLFLSKNPDSKVTVTGHADNTGSDALNQKISTQRSAFIKQRLVDAGIAESSIETAAKSSLEPIADNNTPEGRTKNRRVEIKIN
jgi:peptidoglycan-binding protein ArfA